MTTRRLYLDDAYARTAPGEVVAQAPGGGIVLDASLFYFEGGGQPGDGGRLDWDGGSTTVETTLKGAAGTIVLCPAPGSAVPPVGARVTQVLEWDRRFSHMRVHTALHLLSVVIPLPVTGGAVAQGKGRLDFDMADAPEDKAALERALQGLVDRDLEVTESWITDAELDASPGLVKTMSVAPPRGAGRVRLIRIGTAADCVDLQPCGGTHVRRSSEIGRLGLGKIEKKGRRNRRVYLHLAD